MEIHTHKNTTPHCGAVGPIVYKDGAAWSVNSYKGEVMDWRFDLKYVAPGCPECERHMRAAENEVNRCAACYRASTKENPVELIPDVLHKDVPICSTCFQGFETWGWNNVDLSSFPYLGWRDE